MDQREKNNVRADAAHDQISACVRDGKAIPENLDVLAAAARSSSKAMPEGLRKASEVLRKIWAEETGVDFVE
jgi:hypothetical protein